jgi:hypothetical protein
VANDRLQGYAQKGQQSVGLENELRLARPCGRIECLGQAQGLPGLEEGRPAGGMSDGGQMRRGAAGIELGQRVEGG